MKVLIVDDDRLTVKYISAMMDWKVLGIEEVLEAYGKKKAMEIIEKETVDILLCDIEMPRGNGYELLEWMEENAYRIPTLFITSYARFDYAVRAMRMHVVDYILKPVSKVQLTQAVKRAVVLAGETEKCERHEGSKLTDGEEYFPEKGLSRKDFILDKGSEKGTEEENAVECVKTYMEQHWKENVSRTRMAELVHFHPDYLSRIFKEATGFSMTDYLTELRMQEAKRRLLKTRERISEVALEVGYTDLSYFTRIFRRRFGVSPREYRKQEGWETDEGSF